MSKPRLAIFTAPEGHYSLYQSIASKLKSDFQIREFFHRDSNFNMYVPIYQYFPSLFKVPFQLGKQKESIRLVRQYFRRRYTKLLRAYLEKEKPDALLSTYFAFNPALARLAEEYQLPFLSLVTDPKTIHPLLLSEPADAFFVFDEAAAARCHSYFPDGRYLVSGWFTKPEYETEYKQDSVRRRLKLKPKVLTLLITAGSEGSASILKILPTLLFHDGPLQVIIACGNNKTLYHSIRALEKSNQGRNPQLHLEAIGYTKELHRYMQAADLVIGKAGPNTLFEATATRTPFFAITHIHGQEDGNLDLIRDHKLGVVEERPLAAQRLLKDILAHPEKLQDYEAGIEKMRQHNLQSSEVLKTELDRQLG